MIRVEGLTKVFPNPDGTEKTAVDHISFAVQPGEIYGLLGPNGAGKTTTLRMISGLLRPTAGRVWIRDEEVTGQPERVKRHIGYLTANTGLYARLTPREMLEYFATLYNIPRGVADRRIAELVAWLNMGEYVNLRCGALSTGQKQRTNIARALIADPPILVLDEPTLGLDVLSNRLILEFIQTQADAGKAVLLSTHALDEIDKMCRRMGLIHNGQLIAEGELDVLRQRTGQQRLSEVFLHLVGAQESVFGAAAHVKT
ncbi:MAG TPA: ABC transporter ATP-binding protein [Phycisphaerae bacterium]|nr:ABC transporter ATP-binding protein [Phycisphaerae bacterium]HPM22468.1 ABC transporter ATP-binding protein [Phycisphaerae bacterium]HQL53097.1 ABC transporter ATP-binding protein [Phycisphaerae bacterium]